MDDFEPLRSLICSLLMEDSELQVVDESGNGVDAVLKCEALQPDVVVLDIGLPKMNGLQTARQIRDVSPGSRIVFLSLDHRPELMREALKLGAGYVWKADAARDLLTAVRAAARDEPFIQYRIVEKDPTEPSES